MRRIFIFMTVLLCFCGCRRGFVGGLDDGNMQLIQLVLVNRSPHEVSMTFKLYDNDSIYRVDLEPYEGLWKKTFTENIYSRSFEWAKISFDDGKMICFDESPELPCNPCFGMGTKYVYDSNGNYHVYEISEKSHAEIMSAWNELKTFEMFSVTPSEVVDSLCIKGSSEAIFNRLYPAGEVKKGMKLGAAVRTEAKRIDLIEFDETRDVPPGKTATNGGYHLAPYQRTEALYFDIDELRKMGLAHFGCDFAALTGRDGKEMDRFCGMMAIRAHADRCEYIEEPAFESTQDIGFIDCIVNGQLMILLAEADCSAYSLREHVEYNLLMDLYEDDLLDEDIDFYLITLDTDGNFQCLRGGVELVEIYSGGVADQPVLPIAFSIAGDTGVHIPNVTF